MSNMLSHRCAARVLGPSAARPRIVRSANTLYARHENPSALLRPALAPGVQRRTFIIEPLGNAFLTIHSFTGVPWWLLIPALGFVTPVAAHLPFHVLKNRRAAREALLSPLIAAWATKISRLKLKDPNEAYKKQMKRIYREAKLGNSRRLMLAEMATYIGSLTVIVQALKSAMVVKSAGATAFEPSFVTEGLFWFQDLTSADPLGILPWVMGGLFAYRNLPRSIPEIQLLLTPGTDGVGNTRFKRAGLIFSGIMVAQFMNAPAGAVLFVTSNAVTWLLMPWLDKYFDRYLPPVPNNVWVRDAKHEPWYIEGPPTRR